MCRFALILYKCRYQNVLKCFNQTLKVDLNQFQWLIMEDCSILRWTSITYTESETSYSINLMHILFTVDMLFSLNFLHNLDSVWLPKLMHYLIHRFDTAHKLLRPIGLSNFKTTYISVMQIWIWKKNLV